MNSLRLSARSGGWTLVSSPFNHLAQLIAREKFIILSCQERNRSYSPQGGGCIPTIPTLTTGCGHIVKFL